MRHVSADYVIAGGDLPGLLLAHYLTTKFELASKSIVIIEQSREPSEQIIDFWAKPDELAQLPLHDSLLHTWDEMQLITKKHTHIDRLQQYRLAAISRQSYAQMLRKHLQSLPPISFLHATVTKLASHAAITAAHEVQAQYVFDNTDLYRTTTGPYLHTAGKQISTGQAVFDAHVAVFFDTRIATHQRAAFVRMLPLAANTAIVEARLYAEDDTHCKPDLTRLIDRYCNDHLQLVTRQAKQPYYYVTPLVSQYAPPHPDIVPLSQNAGLVKRSSGHSFMNTTRQARYIAHCLSKGKAPKLYPTTKRLFRSGDDALLRKIMDQPVTMERFYDALTEHVPADQLLAWLDERPSAKSMLTISRAAAKLI